MAVSVKASGSQVIAALNTDYTLATITDAGVYQLQMFLETLGAAERLRVRIYTKATSGDSETLAYSNTFVGPLAAPVMPFVPVPTDCYVRVELRQHTGTLRTFKWKVLQL